MAEQEVWKDIKYYKGYYQVSNLGRVKSLKRVVSRGKYDARIIERILRQSTEARTGYLKVNLSKKGKVKTRYVHKLVATAFHKHKPNGYVKVVDHVNFNKQDNRSVNLQCITQSENIQRIYDEKDDFKPPIECPF